MTRFVLAAVALFSPGGADDALVRRLAADDWSEREAASAALRARGWSARGALRRGLGSDDAEVRLRCRALYDDALGATLDWLLGADGVEIDAAYYVPGVGYRRDFLWGVPWTVTEPYLAARGRDVWPWTNYRLACRDWLAAELEAGVPPWALAPVVAEMRRRDRVFLAGTMPPPRD